jgi:hypothetical protein
MSISNREQIDAGSEEYFIFIRDVCQTYYSQSLVANPGRIVKISNDLQKFPSQYALGKQREWDFFHYGHQQGKHTSRVRDQFSFMAFERAQQYCLDRGFLLLDLSCPSKSFAFNIIFAKDTQENRDKLIDNSLWHGFGKVKDIAQ